MQFLKLHSKSIYLSMLLNFLIKPLFLVWPSSYDDPVTHASVGFCQFIFTTSKLGLGKKELLRGNGL